MWTHILHLTHTDGAGGDVQVGYYSSGDVGEASPGATQYIPAIDLGSIGDLTTAVVDGQTTRSPQPPAHDTVRLLRHLAGDDKLLVDGAFLAERTILGWSAVHAAVGTAGDGQVYTVADPFVYSSGTARAIMDSHPDVGMTIKILPAAELSQRSTPSVPLLGYRVAWMGDGATTVGVFASATYGTVPTQFTIRWLDCAFGRRWGSASTRQCILSHGNDFELGFQQNGADRQLYLKFAINPVPVLITILGPIRTPKEECGVWGEAVVDLSSGVSVTWGWDGAFETDSSVSSHFDNGGNWQMGRLGIFATSCLWTPITALSLFSIAVPAEDLRTYRQSRMTGEETGLELFYPGTTDLGGNLLDETVANAAAPRDLALTGTSLVPSMQGALALAGKTPPLILQGQHQPVYPMGDNFFRLTTTQNQQISRVMDRGNDLTITQPDSSVRAFLAKAVSGGPTAGQAAVCPACSGFISGSSTDGQEFAADVLGCSGWSQSLALGSLHGSARVDFPIAANPGGSDFGFEIWFSWDGNPSSGGAVFDGPFVQIINANHPNIPPDLFNVAVFYPGGALDMEFSVPALTTVSVRVEGWNDGADMAGRLLVNGDTVDSGTVVGKNLQTTFGIGSRLGNTAGLLEFEHLGVLPMRLWQLNSATTRTDADAEADHRLYMFENPLASDPDLLGMWYRSSLAQLDDEVGTNHGVIVNPGTEGVAFPGLAWSDPLLAAVYVANTLGDLPLTSITVTDNAWGSIVHGAIDFVITTPTALVRLLQVAMVEGYAVLTPDGGLTLGAFDSAIEANAALILEPDRVSFVGPASQAIPATLAAYTWGAVGIPQKNPVSGADDNRVALMRDPIRTEHAPVVIAGVTNFTKYNDTEGQERTLPASPGSYRVRDYALAAVLQRVEARATGATEFPVDVRGRGSDIAPGVVVGLRLEDGTVLYRHLLKLVIQGRADLETWLLG